MRDDNIYYGEPGGRVTVNDQPLDPRLDLKNHSPTGFSWGYSGSGPSQLALAVLANEYGDDWAQENGRYMAFKRDVIALFDPNLGFTLTSEDVARWRESVMAQGN